MKLNYVITSVVLSVACLGPLKSAQAQIPPAQAAHMGGPAQHSADMFFVDIEGPNKSQFKAEIPAVAPRKGTIKGIRFSFTMNKQLDAAGKRQYSPITITKEWGVSSPQIFQAFVSNEVLPSVTFEFVKADLQGREIVYQTITLTNATISSCRRYIDVSTGSEPPDPRPLEDITFTFQKIEVKDALGASVVG